MDQAFLRWRRVSIVELIEGKRDAVYEGAHGPERVKGLCVFFLTPTLTQPLRKVRAIQNPGPNYSGADWERIFEEARFRAEAEEIDGTLIIRALKR